jgi:5-methylcytosine-specific restriction endonuclease McrA
MSKIVSCKTCSTAFERLSGNHKFCDDCSPSKIKERKQRVCIDCGGNMPRKKGPSKRCSECEKAELRYRRIAGLTGESSSKVSKICNKRCMICNSAFVRKASEKRVFPVCSKDCLKVMQSQARADSRIWIENPFYLKLSESAVFFRRAMGGRRRPFESVACAFCGSVKVLGDAQSRRLRKGQELMFCDLECACNWKSVHYATDDYEHNRKLRERTQVRLKTQEQERLKAKEERLEAKRIKQEAKRQARIDAMQKGVVECKRCGKSVWFSSRASVRSFCSRRCSAKHVQKNREYRMRANGMGENIGLAELAKKSKWRCVKCNVKCVKPEGYNLCNEATIDHIVPLSKNGLHAWSNVQLLCRRCNTAKRDTIAPGMQLMLPLYGDN